MGATGLNESERDPFKKNEAVMQRQSLVSKAAKENSKKEMTIRDIFVQAQEKHRDFVTKARRWDSYRRKFAERLRHSRENHKSDRL